MKVYAFFQTRAFFRSSALILTVLAGFSGCRKTPGTETPVYRLADLLRTDNVVKSPLAGLSAADLSETRYPVESHPPADVPENPWGLVRKHTAGNVESRVLFAPPGSDFQFDLTLPENPVLSFAVGVVRDLNSAASMAAEKGGSSGVEFIIRLEAKGHHRVIFQKHLDLPEVRESRTLNYSAHRLEVPGGGTKVRLRLITGGSKGAFSLWYSPILYSRGQTRPNVVLVSVDTLRADHVGAYGYGRDTTPHLDALAGESALFRNVFASSPWTLPSHASMMTGLEGRRHGVYYEGDRMNPAQPTLASFLKDRGYATVGITGGAFVAPFYGFSRGFDSYTIGHGELADPQLAARAEAEAAAWLEAHAEAPFFLFLHTYQVHHPYHSPEAYARRYAGPEAKRLAWNFKSDHGGWGSLFRPLPAEERQNIIDLYDGEIRYTDDALLGPLLDKLRSLGLYDRTLLIVTSDHGEEFFEHGGWTHSWSLYNESIKVPCVIKFPGGRHAGRKVDEFVRLTDLVPTVLEVLGFDPPQADFDGRSLVPLLDGREEGGRPVVAELAAEVMDSLGAPRVALSSGRDLLILNGPYKKDLLSSFAFPPPAFPPLELFDLARDPAETKNLVGEPSKAEVVRALAAEAERTLAAVKPKSERKLSKEMEAQLQALGYIK